MELVVHRHALRSGTVHHSCLSRGRSLRRKGGPTAAIATIGAGWAPRCPSGNFAALRAFPRHRHIMEDVMIPLVRAIAGQWNKRGIDTFSLLSLETTTTPVRSAHSQKPRLTI